jgi:hypothetical protein
MAIKVRRTYTIKCDQCEALVINGVACHETGCPKQGRPWVHQDEYLVPSEYTEEEWDRKMMEENEP